jgi:hypothetical protein
MTIPFTELIKISGGKSVMIYSGVDGFGASFFAYIICTPDKAKLMFSDYENGIKRQLFFYGNPIYIDFIPEPDEKAKEFLQKYLAENS